MVTKIKKKLGFTLFELLVSISIIAVLTAVAVVSFGGMNKKTRDARRISDIEKIRVALESAKQVGGTYPVALTSLVGSSLLEKVPVGPKNDTYVYTRVNNSSYRICSTVELVGSTNSTATDCGSTPNGYAGYYRGIQP